VKRGTPEHPKMFALAGALKVTRYAAGGIMEFLWHYTAKYALPGDIGRHPNATIAGAVGWEGEPDELIRALVSCRWLDRDTDHRLLVHDWPDHCDQTVKRALATAGLSFCPAYARQKLAAASPPKPKPKPEPKPKPKPLAGPAPLADSIPTGGAPPPADSESDVLISQHTSVSGSARQQQDAAKALACALAKAIGLSARKGMLKQFQVDCRYLLDVAIETLGAYAENPGTRMEKLLAKCKEIGKSTARNRMAVFTAWYQKLPKGLANGP
jgi:hypothetical protein